jgi:hypothetical protein
MANFCRVHHTDNKNDCIKLFLNTIGVDGIQHLPYLQIRGIDKAKNWSDRQWHGAVVLISASIAHLVSLPERVAEDLQKHLKKKHEILSQFEQALQLVLAKKRQGLVTNTKTGTCNFGLLNLMLVFIPLAGEANHFLPGASAGQDSQ